MKKIELLEEKIYLLERKIILYLDFNKLEREFRIDTKLKYDDFLNRYATVLSLIKDIEDKLTLIDFKIKQNEDR